MPPRGTKLTLGEFQSKFSTKGMFGSKIDNFYFWVRDSKDFWMSLWRISLKFIKFRFYDKYEF